MYVAWTFTHARHFYASAACCQMRPKERSAWFGWSCWIYHDLSGFNCHFTGMKKCTPFDLWVGSCLLRPYNSIVLAEQDAPGSHGGDLGVVLRRHVGIPPRGKEAAHRATRYDSVSLHWDALSVCNLDWKRVNDILMTWGHWWHWLQFTFAST